MVWLFPYRASGARLLHGPSSCLARIARLDAGALRELAADGRPVGIEVLEQPQPVPDRPSTVVVVALVSLSTRCTNCSTFCGSAGSFAIRVAMTLPPGSIEPEGLCC
jgi:hypothetical protein